ncbi:MAG: choice-of-anchor E domain-containing protein, partial [Chitinophagaceae bacterium]|nr:choice-of-anchor E domain-containing protein [Chitinophagaceae bacterium]
MKTKLYLFTGMLVVACSFIVQTGYSQCNCPGGDPATPVAYQDSIPPTSSSSISFKFPKFDPSIGTLTCAKLDYRVSSRSRIGVRNTDTTARIRYRFRLTIANTISGAGVSADEAFDTFFGPDSLGKYGAIDDSTTYGPLQVVNWIGSTNVGSLASYLGTGLAFMSHTQSGGFISTQGGLNYNSQITTFTTGVYVLTYYWCPAGVLARNIRDFNAKLKNENVQIEWASDNQVGNILYEVQVSSDGVNYKTVYTQPSQAAGGNSNAYQFLYNIPSGAGENLYVRIKQTEPNGKVTYSSINRVGLDKLKLSGNTVGVFPNPAINKVSLQFDAEMNGDFGIDIISITGQKMYTKDIK